MYILFRGKYVKPLIELLGYKANSLTIDTHFTNNIGWFLGTWWYTPKNLLEHIEIDKQLVITKKDYQKLLALIPMVDNPIEAFEMIYGEYFK